MQHAQSSLQCSWWRLRWVNYICACLYNVPTRACMNPIVRRDAVMCDTTLRGCQERV